MALLRFVTFRNSSSLLGKEVIARNLSTCGIRRRIFDVGDEEEFKREVLLAKKTVVVDFHAR